MLLLLIMLLGCEASSPVIPKPIDTAKTGTQLTLPINGFYYYQGEYWLDCAGVTVNNTIIRSTTPLIKDWTRDGVGGGYFHIKQPTTDTAYFYLSDGTENPYCGY